MGSMGQRHSYELDQIMNPRWYSWLVAVLLVLGIIHLVWVIVSALQYRREMACVDNWRDRPPAAECVKAKQHVKVMT